MDVREGRNLDLKNKEIQKLRRLNEQSETNTFDPRDIAWGEGVDMTMKWIPYSLSRIDLLPSYSKLTEAQKLEANQATAQALCEQFIWLEEDVLCPVVRRILRRKNLSPEMRICLENFVAEEERHSEMFHTLLAQSDSYYYTKPFKFKYLKSGWWGRAKLRFMLTFPSIFIVWTWMAIFFEEKTLHVSVEYKKNEIKDGQQAIDPLFAKTHFLHMIDEARHVQIDEMLINEFYDKAPQWKKVLNSYLARAIFSALVTPKIAVRGIINEALLKRGCDPVLAEQLIKEIPLIATHPRLLEEVHSSSAMPRFRRLIARYQELDHVVAMLDGKTEKQN